MLLPRIIPVLLLRGRGLVKGTAFQNHKYIGDPLNTIQIFSDKEVDEIVFLDIDATRENRPPNMDFIQGIADRSMMPFAIGGGIRTVEQIGKIISAGAEKVVLCSAFFEVPDLVKEAAGQFGKQAIVVSVDYRQKGTEGVLFTHSGTKKIKGAVLDAAKRAQDEGAGELLLNCVDKDGTGTGYDLEMAARVADELSIPVILSGGAGSFSHLKQGLTQGKASAVAAGSLFVLHGRLKAVLIQYPGETDKRTIVESL